jgi:hypothetical protein
MELSEFFRNFQPILKTLRLIPKIVSPVSRVTEEVKPLVHHLR